MLNLASGRVVITLSAGFRLKIATPAYPKRSACREICVPTFESRELQAVVEPRLRASLADVTTSAWERSRNSSNTPFLTKARKPFTFQLIIRK